MTLITRHIVEMNGEYSVETRFNDGYTKPTYSNKSWKTSNGARKHIELMKSYDRK